MPAGTDAGLQGGTGDPLPGPVEVRGDRLPDHEQVGPHGDGSAVAMFAARVNAAAEPPTTHAHATGSPVERARRTLRTASTTDTSGMAAMAQDSQPV